MSDDPVARFQAWYDDACASEPSLPEACSLATASAVGVPSSRMVLCKSWDERGFKVYTNLASQKAVELGENPHAALCFHWKSLKRQVRISGPVTPVLPEEADAYFAARDRGSQIGAWASKQSQPLPDRLALEKAVARYAAKFGISAVPRPPFWSGFRIRHEVVELWQELPFRLHRRERWTRDGESWQQELLFP